MRSVGRDGRAHLGPADGFEVNHNLGSTMWFIRIFVK
jgi:hypothetical protein